MCETKKILVTYSRKEGLNTKHKGYNLSYVVSWFSFTPTITYVETNISL